MIPTEQYWFWFVSDFVKKTWRYATILLIFSPDLQQFSTNSFFRPLMMATIKITYIGYGIHDSKFNLLYIYYSYLFVKKTVGLVSSFRKIWDKRVSWFTYCENSLKMRIKILLNLSRTMGMFNWISWKCIFARQFKYKQDETQTE